MRKIVLVVLFLSLGLLFAFVSARNSSASSATLTEKIAHGKYIATRVAMCADCHTPVNEKGELIEEKLFQGTPLTFKPTVPVPNWVDYAPPIAGLPTLNEQQGITLLTTGKLPSGAYCNPPMPSFRLNEEDAAAVVAYLKSLKR